MQTRYNELVFSSSFSKKGGSPRRLIEHQSVFQRNSKGHFSFSFRRLTPRLRARTFRGYRALLLLIALSRRVANLSYEDQFSCTRTDLSSYDSLSGWIIRIVEYRREEREQSR